MAVSAAPALSNPPSQVPGAQRFTVTEVTMDTSYPTGGEPLTPADLGLRTVLFAIATFKTAATTAATQAWYDVANQKLKVSNTTGEVANGGSLANVVIQVVAFGS